MTTYAKCMSYEKGDFFPYIHLAGLDMEECNETLYECWQPDELDNEEFNLVILLYSGPVRVRGCHFDFINNR